MNNYNYKELFIGLKEEFSVEVTEDKMKEFTSLSGDINPLHIDEKYAQNRKMLGRVVYGMLTSSFYSTLVGVYLPGEKCLLQGIDIKFKKPAYIGEKLNIGGEIIYMNDTYNVIEVKAYIKNKENEKISTALIKIGVLE